MTLTEIVPLSTLFAGLLIFVRIGTGIMLMPGIGEMYMPARVRLLFALTVSAALTLAMESQLPALPKDVIPLCNMLFIEILIGLFLGTIARMIISVMHILGVVVATQSGLSAAMLFDPNQGAQGAVIGNFMTLLAVTFLFASDIHLVFLRALADSYSLFPAGEWPMLGDMTEHLGHTMGKTFFVAVQMAMPQLVVGTVIFLGAGVMSRLMPSVQIFFIMTPVQITLSLALLMITLSAGMLWYIDHLQESIESFIAPAPK